MYRTPVTVTVTRAAGQIACSLLFRIASGDLLGRGHAVLLDVPGGAASSRSP